MYLILQKLATQAEKLQMEHKWSVETEVSSKSCSRIHIKADFFLCYVQINRDSECQMKNRRRTWSNMIVIIGMANLITMAVALQDCISLFHTTVTNNGWCSLFITHRHFVVDYHTLISSKTQEEDLVNTLNILFHSPTFKRNSKEKCNNNLFWNALLNVKCVYFIWFFLLFLILRHWSRTLSLGIMNCYRFDCFVFNTLDLQK